MKAAKTLTNLTNPWLAYAGLRSAHFAAQYLTLNALAQAIPGYQRIPKRDPETAKRILGVLGELLVEDAEHFRKGHYPIRMLTPEAPLKYLRRIPRVLVDSVRVGQRRMRGRTTEFTEEAKSHLENVPRYYRRNFHFQTDGYLSPESAAVYDHQVELLFFGAGDAMRRLLLQPLVDRFGRGTGKGLSILEVGCGTGSTTRFLKLLYPEARITAVDLSVPYLEAAEDRLSSLPGRRTSFMEAAGEDLPFRDGEFDAVVNVFLFHELPRDVRTKVLSEAHRVLKPKGLYAMVDSMQTGDRPEFDSTLLDFPVLFHEPFYRDYIARDLKPLIKEAGFKSIGTKLGFYSKVCWATR